MSSIKTLIDAYIKRNANQEITGPVLNGVLTAIADALGTPFIGEDGYWYTYDPEAGQFVQTDTPAQGESGVVAAYAAVGIGPDPSALPSVDVIYDATLRQLDFTFYDIQGPKGDQGTPGITGASVSVDANVGTPSVDASIVNSILTLAFHNLRGAAAGFGTPTISVGANQGTPSASVTASGPDTAKVFNFAFDGLKGETGPQGPQGPQGNPGSSQDYPFTLANNLTTDDSTVALTAAMGVQLEGEVSQLSQEVNGESFNEEIDFSLVTGSGIESTSAAGSLPLVANKIYKLIISDNRTNGTRFTFYLKDGNDNRVSMKVATTEEVLPGENSVTSRTVGSSTTELYVLPSANVDRLMVYSAAADVKDTITIALTFERESVGLATRVQTAEGDITDLQNDVSELQQDFEDMEDVVGELEEKFLVRDLSSIGFSAGYLIWTLSGNNVVANASSYNNQRNTSYLSVKTGDIINITQTINGTARKAIFADNNDEMVAVVTYTESVTNYTVPDGATRLYINRAVGSAFSLTVQSSDAAALDRLLSDASVQKYNLPIYAPLPQSAADGQGGTLDAENSTSDQVFAKCDEAIANYTNYATGEVMGKDATNTYDIKRYFLCRPNLFAWRASGPWYAWITGGTTRFIQSASPVVGMSIYGASLTTIVATITAYNCTTGVMNDSNGSTYTRVKSSDIPADIIYTDRQTFSYSFSVYRKDGSVRDGLPKTAWDSDADTITYNSKTYARSRKDDWGTNIKETIVIWANEHAAQSDPHEPSIILYRLIRDLCQSGPSGNKFLSYLKNYCKVIIIPVVNPYGFNNYAINKNAGGRVNGNGVNINRNYPTIGWSAGSVGSDYGGTYGGSENETQYVMNTVIEFDASVGVDLHCLGYIEAANKGVCAYGGNFDGDNEQVKVVTNSMLADFDISLQNYGSSDASGNGSGKNWLLANGIEGGLIEMNAGPYAASFDGTQHSGFILGADYTLLLRMLNLWNLRFSPALSLRNFEIA